MRKKIVSSVVIIVFLFCQTIAFAQASRYEGETVKEVVVMGNKLVSENIILSKVRTKPGDKFSRKAINEDLSRLYDSGYFSKISIDVETVQDGIRVGFIVKEKPMLKEVIFIGNSKIKTAKLKKLMKSVIGEVLNESQIKDDIEAIKEYYEKKGFSLAKIDYEVSIDEASGRAIVTVYIQEGRRVYIAGIKIEGNEAVPAKEILKVMRTRKDTLFTSGTLKEDVFKEDLERITTLCRAKGYLDAKVTDVNYNYNAEETRVWITIEISEGRQYFINSVKISGNDKFSTDELESIIESKPGAVFSPLALNKDLSDLRDFYHTQGYLDARVRASTSMDDASGNMNIVFNISSGEISHIGKVEIRGNTRTKDIVIRREVMVVPGEVCDSIKLRRSQERLQNLGYFKYVDVSLRPTDNREVKNIVIEVEEQKTGEIAFGAGYSSIDYLIGFVEISQKNFDITNFPAFVGGGQKVRLRAEIGSKRRDFVLSFTEPWFLGRRLSAGFDIFERTRKYFSSYFDEKRRGADVRLGVGLGEYNRADLIYAYQMVDITNVKENASEDIKEEAGKRYVGTIGLSLIRDTRDSWIIPTRGYRLALNPEVAGLGGDTQIWKLTGSASIYIPLFFNHIIRFGTQAGIVDKYGDTVRVPIFDRFFLGGATTVRGFDYRDISPRDSNNEPIGGNTMGMATAEYTFPLITRIRGAFFFDIGGVFPETGEFHFDDLDASVGVGVRLNLPVGPIQVDYGIPIMTDENNKGADPKFSFSMGTTF